MPIYKNPITIVQGAPTPSANPLISWGGSSAPAPIQIANGDWFLPYYNNAHGLLMSDKDTKMVEYFSTATEWRVIIRAKITNWPASGTRLTLCGTTNSGNNQHDYPYMYLTTEHAFHGVGINTAGVNEWYGVENLTEKISLGDWYYFCGYQKDSFICYSVYDDDGVFLGVGAKANMHLLANTTHNFGIGGLEGLSTHYAKETYFDLNNIYVEKNGQSLFGTKTAKMQNMGVFNFDDISHFTLCEYIESTGTQYIDTDFNPNNNSRFVVDLFCDARTNDYGIIGSRYASLDRTFEFALTNNTIVTDYGTVRQNPSLQTNRRMVIDKDKNVTKVDGNVVATVSQQTFSCPISSTIFVWKQNAGVVPNFAKAKLYSAKIYDNGTLVRDFVPCYHTATGIIGLFDTVNNKFYTNAGTGEFLKGADV